MQRRDFIAAAAAAAATLAAPALRAQNALPGPVKILVGFPPGGGTDALSRVLAPKLSTMWGVPVVIENRAGAAGVIAADLASKSPSDGTVLLMAHINSHALAPALGAKLSYSVEKDFTPISWSCASALNNPDLPTKTQKLLSDGTIVYVRAFVCAVAATGSKSDRKSENPHSFFIPHAPSSHCDFATTSKLIFTSSPTAGT